MSATDDEKLLARVKAAAAMILDEYLTCESGHDSALYIEELKAPRLNPHLIKKMLTVAMDKSEKDQDMAAGLISVLCVRGTLEPEDVEAGVELLLSSLKDLVIDVPKATTYTARFMAHFLEDKILPESMLASVKDLAGADVGPEVIKSIGEMLSLPLPVTQIKSKVKEIIEEFYVAGDLVEAERSLAELNSKRSGHEAVKRTIVLAMEKKNRERERASVLLSAMTRVYGSEQFFEGFTRVMRSLDDLSLDTPNAPALLANFIARAIVDDVLPPNFISFVPDRLVASERGKEVAGSVKALLEQHSSTRIMNVWGAGAKNSVEELKESVNALVEEYFVEGELKEAVRCVQELDAPHFGHEIVKKIVYKGAEGGSSKMPRAIDLLKALVRDGAVSSSQLAKGMVRSVVGLKDLSLDVPDASSNVDAFVAELVKDGMLAETFKAHVAAMKGALQ
mmetsp:Transcript_41456/g.130580  ORF Transcript_41456/g.130580 Transcript_41456/m.130580 type:complete len:450 (-) Transcript_41456:19-1368(-)